MSLPPSAEARRSSLFHGSAPADGGRSAGRLAASPPYQIEFTTGKTVTVQALSYVLVWSRRKYIGLLITGR